MTTTTMTTASPNSASSTAAAAADDSGGPPATAEETLDLILHTLIPCLLLSSLSVAAFHGRWRALRDKIGRLGSSLSDAARCAGWPRHPLLLDLLPALLATLRSLRSLSDRCHDPSLPGGKLLLQSDLDIAASSLSLRLDDLDLLLRSGLLHRCPPPSEAAADAAGDGGDKNAIVLSQPGAAASKEDLALFVRDVFTRLQIGGVEFKRKALDSLLHLLDGEDVAAKNAAIVAREGDVACLVHLLEASCAQPPAIREQAAAAVSALATASEASRKAVFEEGALGPLLRLLETGSTPLREKAATAIEAMTADPANAWAVPAYGGVQVLIDACRPSGSRIVRACAAGSLRNVAAAVVDVRAAIVDEGAIPVLLELLSSSAGGGTVDDEDDSKKNAVECLCLLASAGSEDDANGEKTRFCVIQEGGLQKVVQLFRDMAASSGLNSELAEHLLRAIHTLSASPPARRILSTSAGLLLQLAGLIKHGNPRMQQMSAALLCQLSPGEEMKRSMSGCMAALLKLMESAKPANSQEVAAGALVSLLAVRSNRKELSKDEKSLTRLVGLLDPANDRVRKELPVSVVMALTGGGGGCGKRVAEMGACQHLQKLAEAEVPGARKALQRITGGRIKSIFSSIAWRE